MTVKRLVAAAIALGFSLIVGSCSPFSGYVADHWPHFAGGEPNGLPPRPGDPGYAQFIAHGQPTDSTVSPAGNAQPANGATTAFTNQKPAGAEQRPSAFAAPPPPDAKSVTPLTPAANDPGNATSAVQGGLY